MTHVVSLKVSICGLSALVIRAPLRHHTTMVTTRAQARRAQRTLLDIPWELVLRTLDFVDQKTYVCCVRFHCMACLLADTDACAVG